MTRRVTPIVKSHSSSSGLIKFVIENYAVGIVVSTLFGASMLVTDAWGLYTLICSDENPIVSAVVFIGVGIALIAPLVVATAIFLASSSPHERD